MQGSLFFEQPEEKENNVERSLYELAMKLDSQTMLIPPFQRDFIWSLDKVHSWWLTIMNGRAIGVIVTYQLDGGGPIYLADGLQRLTSALRVLDSPLAYNLNFSCEQAKIYCDSFSITKQHRIYKTHVDAMAAFHNLNKGTTLTSLEYYAGILKLDKKGKVVYERIPKLIESIERPLLSRAKKYNRRTTSKLSRDSFALFFQYISEYKGTSFWDAKTKISDRPIQEAMESKIVAFLQNYSIEDVNQMINNFEKYMESEFLALVEIVKRYNQIGKPMSRSTLRWIFHLSLWRKNNKRSVDLYISFLDQLIHTLSEYDTLTSRFPIPNTIPKKFTTLALDSLRSIRQLSDAFDVPLYDGYKRIKRDAAAGYHNSHQMPLSKNGEGEVFFEPAILNIARGNKEVEILE